ncbi:glycosyl transferase family 1 [Micromonospora sp. WMMA1996]|uniref:glycosyltransferase family 4 protein n=1 Tax=Micromonospora sp. WMMA1996 TaxID=2039878 RepID=UPI000BF99457|nr:glycosyltransferase [Micromonospora sp. WMMA1996]PGH45677.1 glycosyl transferase family 1 [Micromonospora sp. WMMA1996]
MRVTVTAESRFLRTPDGRVWIEIGPDHAIWTRYLAAFDKVRVVARVLDVPEAPAGANRVDGPGVHVWALPHYVGPAGYVRNLPGIRRAVIGATDGADAVILRVPSPMATMLSNWLDRRGRPYALEVIGDPYDVFAPGVVDHPLRPVLRRWCTGAMRRQCRSAVAVSYETTRTLQARYPARPDVPAMGISSVDLPDDAYVASPRVAGPAPQRPTLVSVGSLEQLYKGIDTLIEAIARLDATVPPVHLVHVGVGRSRPALEDLAARSGLADRVRFVGWLPGVDALRDQLDSADLFVMPSRTEGLPRALIEAMARALPAIGSTAGGIPELLAPDAMFQPGDAAGLAALIGRTVTDPDRLAEHSRRNLTRAREFSADRLGARRTEFYRSVADWTRPRSLLGDRR